MHDELCTCGSGMTFARCHGNPENEHARAQALLEARQIAVLFPSVRPGAREVLARAESVAPAVDAGEARRLVESWTRAYPLHELGASYTTSRN